MSNPTNTHDIIDTAVATSSLSTLVAAVKAAGLVDTLKGSGPFTVFAPVNEAFASLPEGTVESLLKPENKEQLVKVLTLHVVSGAVKAEDLTDGQEVATLQGDKLTVELSNGQVFLHSEDGTIATVIQADIHTSNGVVHVISKVLLPS